MRELRPEIFAAETFSCCNRVDGEAFKQLETRWRLMPESGRPAGWLIHRLRG